MLYTQIRYAWTDETSDGLKPEYETALAANRTIGIFDRNIDGKVEQAELKGMIGSALKANFAKLDRNADGVLDAGEMRAASALMNTRQRRAVANPAPAAVPKKATD